MESKKPKTTSLRWSEEFAKEVALAAEEENLKVNAFILKVLRERISHGPHEPSSEQIRNTVKTTTMNLMLEWNSRIKDFQDALRPVIQDWQDKGGKQTEWETFKKNAPVLISAKPGASLASQSEAVKGVLNFLEGVCYGIENGVLDKDCKAFPIEFFTFELLFPIMVAFQARENRPGPGWPYIDQYLKRVVGEEEFKNNFNKHLDDKGNYKAPLDKHLDDKGNYKAFLD